MTIFTNTLLILQETETLVNDVSGKNAVAEGVLSYPLYPSQEVYEGNRLSEPVDGKRFPFIRTFDYEFAVQEISGRGRGTRFAQTPESTA